MEGEGREGVVDSAVLEDPQALIGHDASSRALVYVGGNWRQPFFSGGVHV